VGPRAVLDAVVKRTFLITSLYISGPDGRTDMERIDPWLLICSLCSNTTLSDSETCISWLTQTRQANNGKGPDKQ